MSAETDHINISNRRAQPRPAAQPECTPRQFALAERAAQFGYWRFDPASGAAQWSEGMARLLGMEPDPAAGPEWLFAQFDGADAERAAQTFADALRTGTSFACRARLANPRTGTQIIDIQGEIERDLAGQAVAALGVVHDVTQAVKAEEERARIQENYRLMTEEASDIILLHAPGGEILFASNALERILKRDITEIEHKKFLDLIHPEDRAEAEESAVVPEPGETRTATYRARHRDGHYIWIEVTTRGVYDPVTGEYRHTISVSRDITARKNTELAIKAAQERAEAANQAKSRFLSNMSHELRTPLNAVIGFTDLMRRRLFGPLGDAHYEQYATLIYDSGQMLLDLISDMLDMAKIESGKLELNFERVDLTGTVEDCARLMKERAADGGLEFHVALPDAPVTLTADKRAVKQVLINLLTNAIKFTPAGGRIDVSLRAGDATAAVTVRDTGVGIPAEDLPRLGRPFEQVCGDPMLAKSGAGLGLALVRALVEEHGGRLDIRSEEGVGTEVTVGFPLAARKRSAA